MTLLRGAHSKPAEQIEMGGDMAVSWVECPVFQPQVSIQSLELLVDLLLYSPFILLTVARGLLRYLNTSRLHSKLTSSLDIR